MQWWPFNFGLHRSPTIGSFTIRKRPTAGSQFNNDSTTPISNNLPNTEIQSPHDTQVTDHFRKRPDKSTHQPVLSVSQPVYTTDQPRFNNDQQTSSTDQRIQNTSQPGQIANQSIQNTVQAVRITDQRGLIIASANTGTPKKSTKLPSISEYDSILYCNGIKLDPTGYEMHHKVRKLVDSMILNGDSSVELTEYELEKTVRNMNQWGRATEAVVSQFMSTHMFPVQGEELAPNGNSQWDKSALPHRLYNNKEIKAPKPDWYVGYSMSEGSLLSPQHVGLINDPRIRKYVQPGRVNVLPFLIVELKSEAMSGTLLRAEHQAAVSGATAVGAMQQLYEKAGVRFRPVDSVVFSMAVSGRLVVLSAHWYSPNSSNEDIYCMSKVKSFVTSEEDHVQQCHNVVRNIVKWATEYRLKRITEVLDKLHSRYFPTVSSISPLDGPVAEEEHTHLPGNGQSKNEELDPEELQDEESENQSTDHEDSDYSETNEDQSNESDSESGQFEDEHSEDEIPQVEDGNSIPYTPRKTRSSSSRPKMPTTSQSEPLPKTKPIDQASPTPAPRKGFGRSGRKQAQC